MAEAFSFFTQAQRLYMEGRWRQSVETLRHCLAALVGKKAEDEDDLADVQAAAKDLNKAKNDAVVGYDQRIELVRRSLKFYSI